MDRVEILVDQYSGEVRNKVSWGDFPAIAAFVTGGVAFHEGRLYGNLNLIQNVIAAILGLTLAISGFYSWWRRKPSGKLGVPVVPETFSASPILFGIIVVLAVLLPLVGASLILVLLLDRLLFKRLGWFSE